jgi:hypothetical protein
MKLACRRAWLISLLVLTAMPVYAETSPWDTAVERNGAGQAVRRFIPPELYSGAPWNGSRELVLRPMNVTHKPLIPHDHPPIQISGPFPWKDDPEIQVIERTRISLRNGSVTQIFAINERGDGLGRLSDRRAGRVRAQMAECFKFPIGVWSQGEERSCRELTIRILELDFTFQGMKHALKFRWNDEGTYIFVPERGMVATLH